MDNQKIPILIYSSLADRHFRKIESLVEQSGAGTKIIHCSTTKELSDKILEMLFGRGIILILIRDNQEMERVFLLQQKLKDHAIVLILEESEIYGMQQSLDLYPRYISYIKDDYTDVFQVLNKMILKIKRGEKNGG